MQFDSYPVRLGIVGSGFIAAGLLLGLDGQRDLVVTKVLTRSNPASRSAFPGQTLLTNSVDELIDHADLIVECSGDPIYGTDVLAKVMAAGLPVVTMDADLQVTTGSYFAHRGFITESDGDQPGCTAVLHAEAVQMGFHPLVYGNIKGFLNHTPSLEEMQGWSKKQGISLAMVTSATDGTKVQIEQVLVANGLGADILQPGMVGPAPDSFEQGVNWLAERAEAHRAPVVEYLLSPPPPNKLPAGVFITSSYDPRQKALLEYYKLGPGPYYTLLRPFVLPHLGLLRTIRDVVRGGGVLLTNGKTPRLSVAAIAKRDLAVGARIDRAIGSFDLRGSAVRILDEPHHIPIGLVADAVIRRPMEAGEQLTFADVEIPDSLALTAWRETLGLLQAAEPVEQPVR